MKKLLALLLVGLILLGVSTCEIADKPIETEETTLEATDLTEAPTLPPARNDAFHDLESAQVLVEDMGIGWNLGNTLDSLDCTWVENELDYETAWGNPVTTRQLIAYIKAQGFDTVRVPVTWVNHIGPAPSYTISAAWMWRVQEIVDWCIEEDLYVIINMHHDEDWLSEAAADYEGVMTRYKAIWSQIAARFQGYSEKLMFESVNEVGFEDLSTVEGCELMSRINAEFTELIRDSGGNNAKRYLLLAGYLADIDSTVKGELTMPDDDRTILCFHYYSPPEFAIADATSDWGYQRTWGTEGNFEELESQFKTLKETYVDNGIPVIIGEFGAIHTDKDLEDVVLYTASIIECALKYRMCPIWWDNGSEIDRTALAFQLDGMQAAIAEAKENGLAARAG